MTQQEKEKAYDQTCEWLYKQLNEGRMECGDIEEFIEEFMEYINSLPEEPVSEDLEQAANDYAHDLLHDDVFETFIAGAEWQKKQTIDKACNFLHHYQEYPNHDIATDSLIEAFKMFIEL